MKKLPKMSRSFIEAMMADDPLISEEELLEEWEVVCDELDKYYAEIDEQIRREAILSDLEHDRTNLEAA